MFVIQLLNTQVYDVFSIVTIQFLFTPAPKGDAIPKSIYDFKVESLTGGTIDFAQFKGKKIMIVIPPLNAAIHHNMPTFKRYLRSIRTNW